MIKLLELETIVVKHLIQDGLNPYEANIESIAETARQSIQNHYIDFTESTLEELAQDSEMFQFAIVEQNDDATLQKLEFVIETVQNAIAQEIAQSICQKDQCL